MADNLINVYDPDSDQIGSIPASQLPNALKQGFQEATHEQVHKYVNQQKYGTTGQQLLTGLEGAGEAATFGLSTPLEIGSGLTTPEDIQGRREENPISHGIGQVGGLVGSSLYAPGGGAAGALETAGQIGAHALIPGAEGVYKASQAINEAKGALSAAKTAGAGINEARQAVTAAKDAYYSTPFIPRLGTKAADDAIQFAMLQGGDEVSKMFSGAPGYEDPATATETALTNIGLSSVLGGVTGAGFGVISPLWRATVGQKTENLLNTIRARAAGETNPLPAEASKLFDQLDLSKETRARLQNDPVSNEYYKQLVESGTQPGEALRQTIEQDKDKVVNNLKTIFDKTAPGSEPISAFEAGQKTADILQEKFNAMNEEVKAGYDQAGAFDKTALIPEESRNDLAKSILSNASEQLGEKNPITGAIQGYTERLAEAPTIAKQDVLLSEISNESQKAYRAGDNQKYQALKNLMSEVKEHQELQIENTIKGSAGPEGLKLAQDQISLRKQNRERYADAMQAIKDTVETAKLGKRNSTFGKFDSALESIEPAKLADKIFDKKSINGLKELNELAPGVLDPIIQYQKAKMLKGVVKNELGEALSSSDFAHTTLFNRYDQLPKEIRDMMFSKEEQSAIEGSKDILREASKRKNPSGTAGTIDQLNKHMPAGILGAIGAIVGHGVGGKALGYLGGTLLGELGRYAAREVPDAIKLSLLKFLGSTGPVDGEAWKVAVDFIDHTYKAQKTINTAAKNVFKSGTEVLAREAYPSDKERSTFERRLKDLGDNPDKLVDVGGKTGHYLPSQGTALAQTSAKAVNYLNSLKPDMQKKSPLDSKPEPTQIQKSDYNRALDIAMKPLILLKDIKMGTINEKDVQHLNNLYPALYRQLKNNLMDKMTDAVQHEEVIPYKTKLGLSLFMGQPLDSTMTPQALTSLNMLPASKPQQPRPSSMGQMKFTQDALSPEQRRESKRLK